MGLVPTVQAQGAIWGIQVPREQRRLAAIVSADVAGYSRLMGRDESGTLAALKTLRRKIIDPRIKAHRGRLVKTAGDSLLLQAAMADHNRDVPPDQRIEF